MNLSRAWAGVVFLLFALLLTGAASALPGDENSLIMDPPPQQAGERVAVFLVLNEQPQQFASFDQFKADAQSRQAQVLQSVRAVDTGAFKSAQSYWIANAIRVEADPATLDRLAAIPGVNHIEPDLTVTINDPVVEVTSTINPDSIKQTKSGYATVWSTDFIEAPSVWESGNNGSGVTIAVIDTGIDASHPAFGGRVTKFVDLVNGDNETSYDDHGHGTHCAGTAAGGAVTIRINDADIDVTLGVAPGADLMGVKVLNDAGSGNFSCILDGVQWAVENGADVLSMSLGVLQYTGNSSEGHISLDAHESHVVSLEVSSEDYGDTANLYEPQFVIAEVEYSDYDPYGSMNPLENLTFSVTDADGNPAVGGDVDWLGFDQQANCYYFKAPYTSNRNAWNGIWKINVTNTGDVPVTIDRIALTESYQSCGNTVLDTAVNNVVAGGKVVVVSAGNSGWYGNSTIGTPGTARDVITVGATDYMMDYRASFSSMGPVNRAAPYFKPDVMAPGVGVISAYPGGAYATMDGTSMACPAVAGTAALMLAGNSSLNPAEVKSNLMETAVHISENGAIPTDMWPNNAYGAGRVNAYEAVNATGGLGVGPSDGILRELIGGPLASYYVSGDTLPIMAVLWNTTAGEPMAGEDLELCVWYDDYYNYQSHLVDLENLTLTTDENGYVYHSVDVSNVPTSKYVYTRMTYGNLRLSDQVYKQQVTPASGPVSTTVPIFDAEYYMVKPNASVEIKYPLLSADGSPYSDSVNFRVRNVSGGYIVDEVLLPKDGVISFTLNLASYPIDPVVRPTDVTSLNIYINERAAGSIQVVEEPYVYQEIISFPARAICPPGKSIDVGFIGWSHGSGRTISQDLDVYVTTLTETQVLSLSPAGFMALSTQGEADMQEALLAEIDAMDPETYATTVKIRNGVGILNFKMPEDGYIGVVRFGLPDGMVGTAIIYGTLDPWLMHRSTPAVDERFYEDMDLSFIDSTFDWPATWNQDAYASVPSTE
ncbi:MAG TPA: S8 family serine peptidase, partial [Methanoculleus thermophilus]|nr:S8 family serine peptidase [Methanoculleus thermophilus]